MKMFVLAFTIFLGLNTTAQKIDYAWLSTHKLASNAGYTLIPESIDLRIVRRPHAIVDSGVLSLFGTKIDAHIC
jgi:hypothetical protein